MSWPHSTHASSSEHNPSVEPSGTDPNVQTYTDLVDSLENLALVESQQPQHQLPAITQYQQASALHPLSQLFSWSPPAYTSSLPLPSPPEWPGLSPYRHRRPAPKVDLVRFVDSLEWLVNAEIQKEDRTCPFCWGEFALQVEDGEEEGCAEVFEDEMEGSRSGGGEWAETYTESQAEHQASDLIMTGHEAEELIAPTLNGAATVPDTLMGFPGSVVNDDNDDWSDPHVGGHLPLEPTSPEPQNRHVRVAHEETSLAPRRPGKRHYAVKLPCGHLFGHMCLVRMLESGERVCPKCRRNIM